MVENEVCHYFEVFGKLLKVSPFAVIWVNSGVVDY